MKHDENERAGLPDRPPSVAAEIFGNRLPIAEHFAHLLADTGVSHGLIGPRETPRLWERHLLNCGIVESVLPHRTRLIDVGSGAGLPGLVLAIARPDLDVVLVEPMLRRTTWLDNAVKELDLLNVQVVRGKAQDFWGKLRAPVVTARAVARLGELAGWCLPLLEAEGRLLALKGETAARELAEDESAVRRAGGISGRLVLVGEDVLPEPTRVVEVRIGGQPVRPTESATSRAVKGPRSSAQRPGGGRRSARRGSTKRSSHES
ncbi:16S rRNA (guanine(527)-N(7))-methyltransferase RsmG [Ornithinimicrobium faecis]|uniref:Ribosomal RNA small subunit methyltransferase G n=1 Tax=Ornithinimicrobium faecis TaxID=2934158 RepID=A0ABY4YTI7_9MICO|nr:MULTISPECIES: 16S rRNA (guanine(527)-N(7))-methyltransferase RsmG [unclassified Ornithinimicrobium]USQ80083.1 16S rRNA (guanine(527)-N(7))-methyltransferase RsmG [Ornithinimicrobium sp. HY1793]